VKWQFHPEALAEYLEAIAWYESRRRGLGAALSRETESLIELAWAAPQRFPTLDSTGIRRASLRHFPYQVLFRATSDSLEVLALAHMRRRPLYWQNRIQE
jgi:toxin ParE1/3/4